MTAIYTTRDGDFLDEIAHRHYQGDPAALRLIMDANPGVARVGPSLPEGVRITLPPLPVKTKKTINILG